MGAIESTEGATRGRGVQGAHSATSRLRRPRCEIQHANSRSQRTNPSSEGYLRSLEAPTLVPLSTADTYRETGRGHRGQAYSKTDGAGPSRFSTGLFGSTQPPRYHSPDQDTPADLDFLELYSTTRTVTGLANRLRSVLAWVWLRYEPSSRRSSTGKLWLDLVRHACSTPVAAASFHKAKLKKLRALHSGIASVCSSLSSP